MLKLALAQINPTIGDIEGNIERMREAAHKARAAGAELVIFPELSLTGYYPGDLLDEGEFLRRVHRGVAQVLTISAELPGLHIIFGAPTENEGPGKDLYNTLLVARDGKVVLAYHKQLLPTYGVFDERRHFEPGPDSAPVLRIGSTHVSFLICEDAWNDEGDTYAVNPFRRLSEAAPDLVVSINASPSHCGKRETRHRVIGNACRHYGLPLVYVNQVGGHDHLVYDGASFAVEPERGVVFEAARFEEDLPILTFDLETRRFADRNGSALPPVSSEGLPACEFYRRQIVRGLRDYVRRCGFKSVVVGSSGGIDSAVTIALAAEALGPENVLAITMPSAFSSSGSVTDSQTLCRNLGVRLLTHPIADLVDTHRALFAASCGVSLEGLSLENLQARIRGTILMAYSNRFGHLLLTTGNKSELSVGYCTLYGDMNGGLGVIGDLYKTEVFALARHINETAGREIIPAAIIEKPPSAELAPGQRDTDTLPPYELLDEVLKYLIEGVRLNDVEFMRAYRTYTKLEATEEGCALIEKIKRMIARNEHKRRQAPPILQVRARAFGSGRQMPIAACHI